MKNKTIHISLLLLLMCVICHQTSAQNSLILKFNDSTQKGVLLSSLHKITFSSNNMILNMNDATTESFAVSGIKKMTVGVYSAIQTPESKSDLQLFPNPATDFIHMKDVSENTIHVSVFSLDGTEIICKVISPSDAIDVSSLPKGLYILKANNKTFKFVKQ